MHMLYFDTAFLSYNADYFLSQSLLFLSFVNLYSYYFPFLFTLFWLFYCHCVLLFPGSDLRDTLIQMLLRTCFNLSLYCPPICLSFVGLYSYSSTFYLCVTLFWLFYFSCLLKLSLADKQAYSRLLFPFFLSILLAYNLLWLLDYSFLQALFSQALF